MPANKIKINEVAKDYGVQSKVIVDLLKNNASGDRKYSAMTVIDEDEFDLVFDLLTRQNAVSSFEEYEATARPMQKAAPQPQPEAKVTVVTSDPSSLKTEEAPTEPAKEKPARKEPKAEAQSKPAQQPKEARQKEEAPKAAAKENKQPAQQPRNDQKKAQQKPKEKRPESVTIRPQGNRPVQEGAVIIQQAPAADANSGQKRRIVDTRSGHVDIERYNQKYDDLATAKSGRASENSTNKQKLNQKSQQYNKKGGKGKQGRRETEAERMKRIAMERKARPVEITIPDEITVGELASRLKMTAAEVIKKLMSLGFMSGINDVIDFETAYFAATELGAKVEKEVVVSIEERIIDDSTDDEANLVPRSPVVVVMGHVDHGKTSLLDYIRKANVTAGEAGGITQHIGAYRVKVGDREITFLDTPGHEAFTTMRARGAQATDIAILVVAADDGIMPQTVEAINHAKAAGVSIVVAINKMDKEGANPDQIMQQLTEYELVPEAWGGDVICVPVSAKTGMNIDELLENVVLVADMLELKANPDRAAKGIVIEARLDKGRGPIATVLVQNGTLNDHDIIVAGSSVGRIRVMTNERGEKVQSAGPSFPVEIVGLDSVPMGGDIFNAVTDERLARELVEQRRNAQKEEQFQQQTKVTLDNLFSQMQEGEMKELKNIVKGDVMGSAEAVRQSLEKLSNEEVRVHIIHGAVGVVNESDVMLANASNAIIVGFNVRPDPVAAEFAERSGVDMRLYHIIYNKSGQAVLGRQSFCTTPWLTERHGYDPTSGALGVFGGHRVGTDIEADDDGVGGVGQHNVRLVDKSEAKRA